MPLEATMMAIDNSEYMRDGDFPPTRLEAVKDACNIVWSAKTQQHAESTVGLLTMAGRRVQLHETLTNQPGRMIAAMAGLKIEGDLKFIDGINVAALGLKHRQNKQQRQRIVTFVGSPILESEKDLEQLGKKLKKNSVAIDVVAFGAAEAYEAKLQKLVEAAKSGDNCHLLVVPAGVGNLADLVISSPIVAGEDGAAPAGLAMGGGLDFNPENDPELAMALRLSLEEERARQEAEQKAKGDRDTGAEAGQTAGTVPSSESAPMQVDEERELTEAEEMELALKMSLEGANVADGVDALIQDADYMAELQKQLGEKDNEKQ